jgi:aspartate/methionine/tyrosine aminotransferase
MSSLHSLSDRGRSLITGSPMAPYITAHFEHSMDADPSDPDRYIGLCIAENLLMWDMLETQINVDREVRAPSVAYGDMVGSQALREQIARFGSAHLWGRSVRPENVVTMAGAGSILETLFYAICEPGDGVLVPTPSYVGFWADLETRDELNVIPIHTSSNTGFRLTPELLEASLQNARVPVKALMLTNPDNPTGRIMSPEDIDAAIRWARSHRLHIIVNNIYALSVHSDRSYVPTASIIGDLANDIHEVWGFSKDFAMSGVRCGVLTTDNQDVLDSVAELAYWSAVSGDTQHLLTNMLSDDAWTTDFVTKMQLRLKKSYDATTLALESAHISYVAGDAGLFLLADFRPFMDKVSWEEEGRLWNRILDEANVNVTPGSACHVGEPGFMRICFATEPPDVVATAIERIGSILS